MSDLIDRQAAINVITEYADRLQMVNWQENPGVPYKAYTLNWCVNTIRDLPSADVQPVRHGTWMEENRRPRSAIFYCSECHRTAYDIQPTRDKAWTKRCRYAYCPNCGARMDGET